jgi:hypothetical protein
MVVVQANKKILVFAFFSQNKIFLKYLDKVYFELKKPATHVTGFFFARKIEGLLRNLFGG